jgi:hypothetical protein
MSSALPDTNVYINSSSSQATLMTSFHNDVQIQLPRIIHAADGYSLKASLHSFTIPNTQTCVNIYNNQLTISGTTVTIATGNYSATTLSLAIAGAFPTISVGFNAITSKITFSSGSSITITGSMCTILNIDSGTTGSTITSKYNIDLSSVQTIYVYTNLGNSNLDTTSLRKRGLLAAVQNKTQPLGLLHYSDENGTQGALVDARTVFELRITLVDDNGSALLATLPFQAMIKFTQVPTGVQNLKIVRPSSLAAPPPN